MSWDCVECGYPETTCECIGGPVEPKWVIGSYVQGKICTIHYSECAQQFEFSDEHGAEAFENVIHQYAMEFGEDAAHQRAVEFAHVNRGWSMEAVAV